MSAATYHALVIDHHRAPVELRERVAIGAHRIGHALDSLLAIGGVHEACVLSTCLRTEIHTVGVVADLLPFLTAFAEMSAEALAGHHATLAGPELVARHLFRVAAGLESIVIGETQILGQVKEAYQIAQGHGATGPLLSGLFDRALAAAKEARTATGIGEGNVSLPSVAMLLAEKRMGSLKGKRAVLLGTGEMARLAGRHLQSRGAQITVVSRRLLDRAERLAEEIGGKAAPYEADLRFLLGSDLLLSATSASHTLIDRPAAERLLALRSGEPLLMVDLAVPRDIDPTIVGLGGIELLNVDDLEGMAAEGASGRQEAGCRAGEIVERHVDQFLAWWQTLEAVPSIRALRSHLEGLRANFLASQAGMDAEQRALLEEKTAALVAKILHSPTIALRQAAERGEAERLSASLRELFDFDQK